MRKAGLAEVLAIILFPGLALGGLLLALAIWLAVSLDKRAEGDW